MELNYILASVALVLLSVYLYLSHQYNYWKRRGIPSADGVIPGLGHVLPVLTVQQSFATLCENIYNKFQDHSMVGFFRLSTPMLLIREPELVKSVMLTNFNNFKENPFKLNYEKDQLLSMNPFFVHGDKWKEARAPLVNSFSSMKLKMLFHLIKGAALRMSKYLKDECKIGNGKVELNLKKFCNMYTGEISSRGMGIEVNNFEGDVQHEKGELTYNEILNKLFENPSLTGGIGQLIMFFMPGLANFLRLSITPTEVDSFFRQTAKTIITHRKKTQGNYNDFMKVVLEYHKTHESTIDEEILVASHMLSFATDVYETTAITLSFLIFELARHPEIQENVRQEMTLLSKKYNGEVLYETLQEMPYLEKVLSESMRLHHIVGMLLKVCTKETRLEGSDGLSCTIKPGNMVAISTYGLQGDSEHWPDPEKFDPERFSEEQKGTRHKFAFLGFGEGPRICVGMRMAIIMIKVATFTIFKDFSVEVSPKMLLPLRREENSFLNVPQGGFWVNIKPLTSGV